MDLGKGIAWLVFLGIMMVFAPSESRQARPPAGGAPLLAQALGAQASTSGPQVCESASVAASADTPVN